MNISRKQINLHSTMFLLIQEHQYRAGCLESDLHSTMFLLIRIDAA